MGFEEEISIYLRTGMLTRIHAAQERATPLDLQLIIAHPEDRQGFFGARICGYYQRLQLNKRRLYEQLDR